MGSAVSIGKIKIQTSRMPNVSWVDLLVKRRNLKRAIAEVVTGNLALWREFQDRGALRITELVVEERKIPGGRTAPPALADMLLMCSERRATSDHFITGFRSGEQTFKLPAPIYLRSDETASYLILPRMD